MASSGAEGQKLCHTGPCGGVAWLTITRDKDSATSLSGNASTMHSKSINLTNGSAATVTKQKTMKKLIKSLPALGLVLAASMAFAFNMPGEAQEKYGLDNGVWYDVTNTPMNEQTYQCDASTTSCLFDQPHGVGQPLGPNNTRFVKIGDLPIAP